MSRSSHWSSFITRANVYLT